MTDERVANIKINILGVDTELPRNSGRVISPPRVSSGGLANSLGFILGAALTRGKMRGKSLQAPNQTRLMSVSRPGNPLLRARGKNPFSPDDNFVRNNIFQRERPFTPGLRENRRQNIFKREIPFTPGLRENIRQNINRPSNEIRGSKISDIAKNIGIKSKKDSLRSIVKDANLKRVNPKRLDRQIGRQSTEDPDEMRARLKDFIKKRRKQGEENESFLQYMLPKRKVEDAMRHRENMR